MTRLIGRIARILMVASMLGLAVTMVVQVVLRYVLNQSLMGVEEISILFGIWIYYIGFVVVTVDNEHIKGGVFRAAPGSRRFVIASALSSALCLAICLVFLKMSFDYNLFIAEIGRRSTFLRWPTLLWTGVLSIAFAGASVWYAAALVRQLRARKP